MASNIETVINVNIEWFEISDLEKHLMNALRKVNTADIGSLVFLLGKNHDGFYVRVKVDRGIPLKKSEKLVNTRSVMVQCDFGIKKGTLFTPSIKFTSNKYFKNRMDKGIQCIQYV